MVNRRSTRKTTVAAALLAALALGGVAAPTPASAQTVSGIALPSGASPFENGDAASQFDRLLGGWARERGLDPQDGTTNIAVWTGAAYKPGRSAAARAALQRGFKAAGYTFEEFPRDQVRVSPFEESIGLGEDGGPLHVTFWNQQTYFVATSDQKQETIVGVWFDQEHDKRLVLAVARAGFKGTPKAAPLPAVGGDAILVRDHNDAMKGIAGIKTPAFPAIIAKPGRARGFVKDGSGKPLVGARVVVESSVAGGVATSVTAKTDASGYYEAALPQGACRVVMSGHVVRYNGRTYALPLHPVDGEAEHFPSGRGHVEHLVLRSWGVADPLHVDEDPKYGGYYYGGSVRVMWLVDDIGAGGMVEVTLTPSGPLIDGGRGRPLVFRLANKHGGDFNLNNIPIGRYVLTARLLDDGEATPIRAEKVRAGEGGPADSLTVDFQAKSTAQVFTNSGGIERFDVVLKF
ncbi:MAG TPA: carboxypeptidase-like regulatory domain-containing protein [Armatimonadaceae bacterium]|nr:carboxypeptidase-like regulatory domain-containing protein [Armatimonadaceae bacterium]